MSRHERKPNHAQPETVLDALLAQEASAATELERAHEESTAMIAAAREQAATISQQGEVDLANELASLEAQQAQSLTDIEQEVSQASTLLVSKYRNVASADIDQIAKVLLGELLDAGGSEST